MPIFEQLNNDDSNEYLHKLVTGNKPFAVIRGGYEYLPLFLFIHRGYVPKKVLKYLRTNNGMYPISYIQLYRFYKEYIKSLKNATAIGRWGWLAHEDYFIRKYFSEKPVISTGGLEPYYYKKPWSRGLKGKKVLVVHPFDKSIETQFKKRNLLFESNLVLPDMELITYKSVQSLIDLEPHKNWSESLRIMKNDIAKINFDIAILGCGVYATPLATFIKDLGKGAIQIGGATQILFGIKGKRWVQQDEYISKLFNDHWIFPNENETPKFSETIENSCYW